MRACADGTTEEKDVGDVRAVGSDVIVQDAANAATTPAMKIRIECALTLTRRP